MLMELKNKIVEISSQDYDFDNKSDFNHSRSFSNSDKKINKNNQLIPEISMYSQDEMNIWNSMKRSKIPWKSSGFHISKIQHS